jgi:hypothetical protein
MLSYCMDYDLLDHIRYLELEIEQLRSSLRPSGTGHLHTAISVLELRLHELYKQLGYYDVEELRSALDDQ